MIWYFARPSASPRSQVFARPPASPRRSPRDRLSLRSRLIRRILLATIACLALSVVAPRSAWAGSYLDRAAILLDQSRKEGDMLQPRTHDKELARMIKALCEVRTRAGRTMEVPPAIAKAHPHLLLVLENAERAADAALSGNFKKFMEHLNTARAEETTFRALVSELGYAVPEVGPKKR